MANVTIAGATYSDVPAIQVPSGNGIASFYETKEVTYNLTGGATASISTSEVVTGQGFSVKLKAPAGYNLNGVTVTMDGVDITSQVFRGDKTSDVSRILDHLNYFNIWERFCSSPNFLLKEKLLINCFTQIIDERRYGDVKPVPGRDGDQKPVLITKY